MKVPSNVELLRFTGAEALAGTAAAEWLNKIAEAKRTGSPHTVALSGGRSMKKFFAEVVAQARAKSVTLNHVHFFWADERCVPPDDPASNFRLAHELLLAPLAVPTRQIHRIHGELAPEVAAAQAEAELCATLANPPGRPPALDLVLLGMGEDGHVASLFPDEPEADRVSPAVYHAIRHSPKPPRCRVTLGYGALAAAHEVWVLVSGAEKTTALRESLQRGGQTPLGRVIGLRSNTRVLTVVRLD